MTLLCVQHRNAVTSGNIPPRVRGREREGEGGRGSRDPICKSLASSSLEEGVEQIYFVTFMKQLQAETHYWLRGLAFREYLQSKLGTGLI